MADKMLVVGSTPRLRFIFVDNLITRNPIDISLATLVARLERPDGSRVDRTAILETTGLDGAAIYDMTPEDSTAIGSGLYKAQGRATWSPTKAHNTMEQGFFIYPGLAAP